MNSNFLKLLVIFFIGTLAARSQTLNWGSLTGSDIVDSHGGALDNTFIFQLGAFEAGFIPDETNKNSWDANWHVFDTASYSNNPAEGGYFTGTKDLQDVSSYSSLFAGMAAFLWIRNDTGSEQFLATATGSSGGREWKFPTIDAGCCPNGEVTTWSVSDLASDVPIWGSQGYQDGGGYFDVMGPFNIQTHAVPEPGSTAMLALCGIYIAIFRRRQLSN